MSPRQSKRAAGTALVRAFRLSDDYELLLALQGGRCALCPSTGGKIPLNVDHDHKTLEIRGLLCAGCNRKLPEYVSPDWLRRAATYLENPPAKRLA